jgi:hypothetical protein
MAAFSRMQKYPSVLTSLGTVGEANKKRPKVSEQAWKSGDYFNAYPSKFLLEQRAFAPLFFSMTQTHDFSERANHSHG